MACEIENLIKNISKLSGENVTISYENDDGKKEFHVGTDILGIDYYSGEATYQYTAANPNLTVALNEVYANLKRAKEYAEQHFCGVRKRTKIDNRIERMWHDLR